MRKEYIEREDGRRAVTLNGQKAIPISRYNKRKCEKHPAEWAEPASGSVRLFVGKADKLVEARTGSAEGSDYGP